MAMREIQPGAEVPKLAVQPVLERTKAFRDIVVQSVKSSPQRPPLPFSFCEGMSIVFRTLFSSAESLAKKIQDGDLKLTAANIRWLNKDQIHALKTHTDISKLQGIVTRAIAYEGEGTATLLTELLTDTTFSTQCIKPIEAHERPQPFETLPLQQRLQFIHTQTIPLAQCEPYEYHISQALYNGIPLDDINEKNTLQSCLQRMDAHEKIAFMSTWEITSENVSRLGLTEKDQELLLIASQLAGKDLTLEGISLDLKTLKAALAPLKSLKDQFTFFKSCSINQESPLLKQLDEETRIAVCVAKGFPLEISANNLAHVTACLQLLPYGERLKCLNVLTLPANNDKAVENKVEPHSLKALAALFGIKDFIKWQITNKVQMSDIIDTTSKNTIEKYTKMVNDCLRDMPKGARIAYLRDQQNQVFNIDPAFKEELASPLPAEPLQKPPSAEDID